MGKKDHRIKVFHKKNSGVADARNYGVARASGEYIAFIDSDDVISVNYIDFLYTNLIRHEADILCCDYFDFFDSDNFSFPDAESKSFNTEVVSGYEACKRMLGSISISLIMPCCKLSKSSIIKNNPFPVGHTREDEATSYKYYYYSNKVVLSSAKLYAYCQNPTSIMHGNKEDLKKEAEWAFQLRCDFFDELGELELTKEAINSLLNLYIYSNDSIPKRLDKNFLGFLTKYWFTNKLKRNSRIKIILFFLSPRLFNRFMSSL